MVLEADAAEEIRSVEVADGDEELEMAAGDSDERRRRLTDDVGMVMENADG